jgi:hypothetical protein
VTENHSATNLEPNRTRLWLVFGGVLLAYATALLIYSQTAAYHYDEGYHLLTAQLILAGKTPYLDFCFPQSPLNAYFNAGWMRLFGESWRVAHVAGAAYTIGSLLLMASFLWSRFPIAGWRFATALGSVIAIGLHEHVFEYGTLGQPYGICLLTLAGAFRAAVAAVDRKRPAVAGLAGLLAGIAAGSSLLAAAAAPVFLVWMPAHNRSGSRWTKLAAFAAAAAVPWTPVMRIFVLGPRQTWFNLFQYHMSYRKLYWPETTRHDLEVLISWVDSGQGLALGALAVFGLLFVARRSGWPAERKAEFYLCGWLAAAICAEAAVAHPTFSQYFVLAVPFLTVPALAGLYALAASVLGPDRWKLPVALLAVLFALGLAKSLNEYSGSNTWAMWERAARRVNQVTPPGARVLANEQIYFLTKRVPPPGMELAYTHELRLPAADEALFHLLTNAQVKRMLQEDPSFATALVDEDEQVEAYALKDLYSQHATLEEQFELYWNRK